MTLGEVLRGYRQKKRWTQAELAEKSGVPQTTISRLEKDKANPLLESLIPLSITLDVNLDDLLIEAGMKPQSTGGPDDIRVPGVSPLFERAINALRGRLSPDQWDNAAQILEALGRLTGAQDVNGSAPQINEDDGTQEEPIPQPDDRRALG